MNAKTTRRAGFTLVELLVVIGIIALLISILLPSLSSARRSANSVKCASSMKQIFNAFKMYEIDNKGYWPVTVFKQKSPTASGKTIPVAEQEQHWVDLLSKYLHKTQANGAEQIAQYRRSSVLWGCPAFSKVDENGGTYAENVRNGYGMSHYAELPLKSGPGTRNGITGTVHNRAYISEPDGSLGTWHKANIWQRKGATGSASRGLIADGNNFLIDGSTPGPTGIFKKALCGFQTGTAVTYVPNDTNGIIGVDASRHSKPGRTVDQMRKERGVNMLFLDGHVDAVTPPQAWAAIRNDGIESAY